MIPAVHRTAIIDLALAEPQLSPRELAVTYTDRHSYFVSESSVYRLLKAQDLITSPAYILMQASDTFQQPSTRVNELWQIIRYSCFHLQRGGRLIMCRNLTRAHFCAGALDRNHNSLLTGGTARGSTASVAERFSHMTAVRTYPYGAERLGRSMRAT